MKRLLSVLVLISMALGITAFECASKEMTSAKMYINQKKYDKAIEYLQQEITKNPKNDEAFFLLGRLVGDEGKINEMLTNFDKSLEISPKFKAEIENLRLYHWSTGFNKAIGKFNSANSETDPAKSKELFAETIQLFKQSIACAPDSVMTYQNLAYAEFNAGKRADSKATMAKALEMKDDLDMYTLYIQLLTEDKEFDKVISVAKKARAVYPEDAELLKLASNAYVATGQIETALESFKEGVAKEPENKIYRYNYGSILLNAKKYDEAIAQLEKAVEIDPEYTNAIYNLGVAYVNVGAQVREDNEAKEIDSDEYKSYFNKALPLFEKYLEVTPDDAKIWELMGQVYANLGMTEKSREAFEKADSFR